MNAELIAIGSELVCGAHLDTNSQWLSRELEARGWTVTRHTTIADDLPAMIEALQAAARRCRIVLVTGGLGPTRDDITRDAIAEAFDQPSVEDQTELEHILSLFARLNRKMPERNSIQAMRPRDAVPLRNNHGTAPGFVLNLTDPDCLMAAMPGVPREMKNMFNEQLVAQLPKSPVVMKRVVLRTFGYGESHAEERLGDLTDRGRNPEVGITASGAVISLSVTARADTEEACSDLIEPVLETINEQLGDAVYGSGSDELHDVVRQRLANDQLTVALAEGTSTGGLLSQWLCHNDGSQRSVVHSDRLIPGGEATTDLVQRCESVRHDADYAVVTSHSQLSTNDEGTAAIMRGQFAVMGPGFSRIVDVDFAGDLGIFRERAARMALNLIRLHMSGYSVERDLASRDVRENMNSSPQEKPIVRAATADDLPELNSVVNYFVRANRLLPRTVDELQDLLPFGFVAISDNAIVGFAALEIYSPKLAEIRSLAVMEHMQGQGIGRLLVEECVRLAQSRNILEVMAVTSSDDFFVSCGFDFTLPGEKKALFIQTRKIDD